MQKLVLIRHGESQWNKENRFTGWVDVDLTEEGVKQAKTAGTLLREEGFIFDAAYTSVLKRAIRTLWVVLDELDLMWIPVHRSWRLNERHYGALQGLNKAETAKKYGDEQVLAWRRSFSTSPPEIDESNENYPGRDPKYSDLSSGELPRSECLRDTIERFMAYWDSVIAPSLREGQRAIIVAHGNTLRALIKYLDNLSEEEIVGFNIPTGVPLVYELDNNLRPLKHSYLGDKDHIAAAVKAVENQTKSS